MSWFDYKGIYLMIFGGTHAFYAWFLMMLDKHPLYLVSCFIALTTFTLIAEFGIYLIFDNLRSNNRPIAKNNKFMIGLSILVQPLLVAGLTILI